MNTMFHSCHLSYDMLSVLVHTIWIQYWLHNMKSITMFRNLVLYGCLLWWSSAFWAIVTPSLAGDQFTVSSSICNVLVSYLCSIVSLMRWALHIGNLVGFISWLPIWTLWMSSPWNWVQETKSSEGIAISNWVSIWIPEADMVHLRNFSLTYGNPLCNLEDCSLVFSYSVTW